MADEFKITNRSGQTLVGDVRIANIPKGLVFIQHGLSGFRKQPYLAALCDYLHQQSFTVCAFDAANSFGESDGALEQATLTRHHNDLVDVISWAKGQSWYQSPYYLVGHSLGGASVILYAARYPEEVAALAPLSTVTGGKNWIYAHETYVPADWGEWQRTGYREKVSKTSGKTGRISMAFVDDLRQYELLELAPKLTMPVFMMVGDKDTSTPVECQKPFFEGLSDKVKSASCLHIVEGAAHTFEREANIQTLCQKLIAWLCPSGGASG